TVSSLLLQRRETPVQVCRLGLTATYCACCQWVACGGCDCFCWLSRLLRVSPDFPPRV
ncbi:hypothetical protein NDU88_001299, partial [Pleurodeles waltl]